MKYQTPEEFFRFNRDTMDEEMKKHFISLLESKDRLKSLQAEYDELFKIQEMQP